jgi:hypothetical protein
MPSLGMANFTASFVYRRRCVVPRWRPSYPGASSRCVISGVI